MAVFRYIVFAVFVAAGVAAIVAGIMWLVQWRLLVIEVRAQKYQTDEARRAAEKVECMMGKGKKKVRP